MSKIELATGDIAIASGWLAIQSEFESGTHKLCSAIGGSLNWNLRSTDFNYVYCKTGQRAIDYHSP